MKTITVGELRQNPTAMLDDVQAGEFYTVTRHGRAIARVAPVAPAVELIPAKRPGPIDLSHLPQVTPTTADSVDSVDELVEWAKGDR